jgi:hypothetical protein
MLDPLLDFRMKAQKVKRPGQSQSRSFMTRCNESQQIVSDVYRIHGLSAFGITRPLEKRK